MKNNQAYKNILKYVNDNNLIESEIKSFTSQQLLDIMYPGTGIKPVNSHATPELVLRCLKGEYAQRLELKNKQDIKIYLEEKGMTVIFIELQGSNTYLIGLKEI